MEYDGKKWPDSEAWYLVTDADAFIRHKGLLDKQIEVQHGGWPESYPCFVQTRYDDGGDNASAWRHEFMYVPDVYRMWKALEPFVPQAVAQELMR